MSRPSAARRFCGRLPCSLAAGFSLLLLAACASTPQGQSRAAPNPDDPFERFNRSMYAFNDGLDRAVLKPAAELYRDATPQPVRGGVTNFFVNLGDVWSFANNLLQGKGEGAFNSIVRVGVNTVFGLGGLIDIASEAGIARRKQDFGQTLGHWGVPAGPYLVLPLAGPSTVRDSAASIVVDWSPGNPLTHIDDVALRNSLFVLKQVDARARLLGATDMLDSVAMDRYSLTRDVYLGMRRSATGQDGSVPDEEDDDDDGSYDSGAGRLPDEGDWGAEDEENAENEEPPQQDSTQEERTP